MAKFVAPLGPIAFEQPRSLEELVADACEAELHHRWDVSLALWRELQLRAPGQVDAYVGQATALRRLGRFDECDRLLREGMAELPDDAHLYSNYAVTAHQRGDLIEAAQRQQEVLVRFPDNRPVMLLALTYLRQAKLFNEAEIVVKRGIEQYPGDSDILFASAFVAHDRGDWPEAHRRWEVAWRLFPDLFDPDTLRLKSTAAFSAHLDAALGEHAEGAPDRVPAQGGTVLRAQSTANTLQPISGASPDLTAVSTRALALAFESLGGSCEFGLVQRRLGAEPLGLFRWTRVYLGHLIELLENDLSVLEEPQHTELVRYEDEYIIRDRDDRFAMHTFVRVGHVDESLFFEKQYRRLRYLRRKFLEDLQGGEKTFVYKFWDVRPSDDEIFKVHDALCRHAPNALLITRPHEPGHPIGSVETLRSGVMVGYLGRCYVEEGLHNVPVEPWRKLCEKALALRRTPMTEQKGEHQTSDLGH